MLSISAFRLPVTLLRSYRYFISAEDPATGGASGPLGCYLVKNKVVTPEKAGAMLSLQGVKMGP